MPVFDVLRAWFSAHRRDVWLALAAAVLLLIVLLTVGKLREIACRRQLVRAGFPDSYAVLLAPVQADHPNWRFVPLKVSDLSWDAIVDKECTPAWNLMAYTSSASYGDANYRPYYAKNAKAYDSGGWYQASREAVAFFMDPRNFLDEAGVFMFESLEYNAAAHTREAVERALERSFMGGTNYDGGSRRFSELLLDVGRELKVSPVFLAARLAIEQGSGTVQGLGVIGDSLVSLSTNSADRIGNAQVWGNVYRRDGAKTKAVVSKGAAAYNGVYNLFNIGACGLGLFEIRYNAWREATSDEVCRRYCGPWTSQERAIRGGATKVKERYLDTLRHTRYFQKFSVLPAAGSFRWKQYMQNIAAPLSEARNTFRAYDAADQLDAPHRFLIPLYADMPSEPAPDPAAGRSVYSPVR